MKISIFYRLITTFISCRFDIKCITSLIIIGLSSLQLFALNITIATSYDKNFYDKLIYFPSGAKPTLVNSDTAYLMVPLELNVIFTSYSRTSSGNANIKLSYKILKPGGSIYFDTAGIEAFSGRVEDNNGFITTRVSPQIRFSKNDKPGKYKLIVNAQDMVNMSMATREKEIVLSKSSRPTPTFDVISFNIWLHNYCNSPDPVRAIPAFSYFIASDASNDDAIFWPVFYFFQCLFRENPSLVSELVTAFPKSPVRLKEYIVLLLRSIDYKKDKNSTTIPDSLWKKFDNAAENGFIEPFSLAYISSSPQVVEFAFYYYGRYSMIRFLVDCLGASTDEGFEVLRQRAKRYNQPFFQSIDRKSALKMSESAKMILEKAYSKQLLIKTFCDYAFEYDDIGNDSKKVLGSITGQSGK